MQTKTKKIVNVVAAIIPAAMVIMSGIMKYFPPADMLAGFEHMGIAKYMPLLGAMEIGFSILYIIPRTMKIGFILLSCYFAGALATELSYQMPFNALLPMALVWAGTLVRDASVILPLPAHDKTARA